MVSTMKRFACGVIALVVLGLAVPVGAAGPGSIIGWGDQVVGPTGKLPAFPFPSMTTLFDMETLPVVVVAFVASAMSTTPLVPTLGDTSREALFESEIFPFTHTGPVRTSVAPLERLRSPFIFAGPSVRDPEYEYDPSIVPPATATSSQSSRLADRCSR